MQERILTSLMKSDFNYELPQELIAQKPAEPRDSSRLLAVNRTAGTWEHRIFHDITDYLHAGDVLVVNDSRVIPARLTGVKRGSGIEIETVLLRRVEGDVWEALTRPGRRTGVGKIIDYGVNSSGRGPLLTAEVTEIVSDGVRLLKFSYEGDNIYTALERVGQTPLPPYITEKLDDGERYQTVYARELGSAAAPTAGLHLTLDLMDKIRSMGVKIVPVMLHVGLGTFRPVKEDKIYEHVMHSEYFSVTRGAADAINNRAGRVIAVGTTSCRVLESAADEDGKIRAMAGDTDIFIYPGYKFKAMDALITNFHLPESTLLMLVSAFSSRELIMSAYAEAIKQRYRFFSFGDAMLLY